jgi:hypothetical protein
MKKILFIFLPLIFKTTSKAENVEKKFNKNLNKITSNRLVASGF